MVVFIELLNDVLPSEVRYYLKLLEEVANLDE